MNHYKLTFLITGTFPGEDSQIAFNRVTGELAKIGAVPYFGVVVEAIDEVPVHTGTRV
jgi:hypothetical protein